jgi:hypothetical protein
MAVAALMRREYENHQQNAQHEHPSITLLFDDRLSVKNDELSAESGWHNATGVYMAKPTKHEHSYDIEAREYIDTLEGRLGHVSVWKCSCGAIKPPDAGAGPEPGTWI